ncbi:MAG: twin-arginine translocase TatA/TatE family subunit [Pseudomonadota bacterium]|nr:twin-arginine translocase TatA/TatE family subunit [Pseudomonadota bacterium]
MFDLGLGEMLVIAVLVIVFVGPDGLPDLMRVLGRFYGQMRRASDDLRRTFNAEVARVDADRRREELRQRRLERERARTATAEAPGEPATAEAGAGLDEELDDPPMLPPDPRLPPDAAARALPRTAPGIPRVPGVPRAAAPLPPPEAPSRDAEAPAADPLPVDPADH